MAIGTSITPRSYNVDVTGRDYVLDSDPLLNIAERAYASQRETQRMIGAVAQQGVQLGEYIGARQQLGRVKAALGELDVNDPMFAQKYAAVVADNPLAFTNEKVAPATKMAVTPVLASAAQAMENQAALQRAQVMAGYQRQAAVQRAGLQQEYYDYQRMNPRPVAPKPPSAGERLLFGTPAAVPANVQPPATSSGATPSAAYQVGGSPDAGELPVGGADYSGPSLFPEDDVLSPVPQGPAFEPDETVTGEQGDAGGMAYGNGVLQSPTGVWDVTSVSADGVTAQPRRVAARPETAPEPGKQWTAKSFNVDGSVAEYAQEPIPESLTKAQREVEELIVGTNPLIALATQNAVEAKAMVDVAEKKLTAALDADKPAAAAELAEAAKRAAAYTVAAETAAKEAQLNLLAERNPRAAAEVVRREVDRIAELIPKQGTGEYGYEELLSPRPATPVVPPAPASAREQIASQRNAATNQVWTEEKTFALREAAKLDAALEFTPGTVARAMTSDVEAKRVLDEAERRGIQSPLFTAVQAPGYSGPSITTRSIPRYARSQRLGRSYRDILGAAAKEQPGFTGGGSGFKWTRK